MSTLTSVIPTYLPNSRLVATIVSLIGMALASVGLVSVTGIAGLFVMVVIVAIWQLSLPPYAFAAGQLGLVALTPESIGTGPLLFIELGLFGLLGGELLNDIMPTRFILIFVGAVLVLLAITQGSYLRTGSIFFAVLMISTVTAVAVYGLGQYEILRLVMSEENL